MALAKRGQMAIKLHNSNWLLLALLSLAGASGCFCQAVPLPGERCCPTDARRLYCTCGEEAVRRGPCGPDSQFYGLKPTCWRAYRLNGASSRDGRGITPSLVARTSAWCFFKTAVR